MVHGDINVVASKSFYTIAKEVKVYRSIDNKQTRTGEIVDHTYNNNKILSVLPSFRPISPIDAIQDRARELKLMLTLKYIRQGFLFQF